MLIVPALCFPAVKGKDLTPLTMNWTCLIYGGVMTIALSYYALSARKWFKGPRVNIDYTHEGMEVLEGQAQDDGTAKNEKQTEGPDVVVKS